MAVSTTPDPELAVLTAPHTATSTASITPEQLQYHNVQYHNVGLLKSFQHYITKKPRDQDILVYVDPRGTLPTSPQWGAYSTELMLAFASFLLQGVHGRAHATMLATCMLDAKIRVGGQVGATPTPCAPNTLANFAGLRNFQAPGRRATVVGLRHGPMGGWRRCVCMHTYGYSSSVALLPRRACCASLLLAGS